MERLQKVIANRGVTSRRKAEELITQGRVKVNGKVVRELGTTVNNSDEIEVDDLVISNVEKVYYIMNKPRGVITSSSDDKDRKTVVDLIDDNRRIYPVGRLDYMTTGLLILTNDGELANLLMHPKNGIEKTYIAKIEGLLSPKEQMILKNGVTYEGVRYGKAKIKVRKYNKDTNTSIIEVKITEGKNHQIKNMFSAVNHEVIKLKREKLAFLTLDGLNSGEYRKLSIKEVKTLYSLIKK